MTEQGTMIHAAVVGGSGYTGVELVRLLGRHPRVRLVCATSRQYTGRGLSEVFPSLQGITDLRFSEPDPREIRRNAHVAFSALPHVTSMELVPRLLDEGLKVVDLSADFRFRDAKAYAEWYHPHTRPDLLAEAVYGLPELYAESIRRARLVGNPGCYPTSVILGLAPLLHHRRIDPATIIVDAKSGASGAGRGLVLPMLFCEVNEAFKAYKVAAHRHTPEMEQELSRIHGNPIVISFTPHLVPMTRGMLSTIYARLLSAAEDEVLLSEYRAFYRNAPFVRVAPADQFPGTSQVTGSNYCDIGLKVDPRTGRVIVVSAIDNLVKGASGQAVQNMNLMFDLPETLGLDHAPLFP